MPFKGLTLYRPVRCITFEHRRRYAKQIHDQSPVWARPPMSTRVIYLAWMNWEKHICSSVEPTCTAIQIFQEKSRRTAPAFFKKIFSISKFNLSRILEEITSDAIHLCSNRFIFEWFIVTLYGPMQLAIGYFFSFHLASTLMPCMVACEIKLFECFISHVTTTETEIKLFHPLKEFRKNNSKLFQWHVAKYSWAACAHPRAEIKLFQPDVDEGWNNFEIILFHM